MTYDALPQSEQDNQYCEMVNAFRATGGIACCEEITAVLCTRTDQPVPMLARWIVAHEILSFEWQSRTALPLFQFDIATMTPRKVVSQVIRELLPVLSDWEASLWFARPNAWLHDAAPVDAIAANPRAVFEAARTNRFLE